VSREQIAASFGAELRKRFGTEWGSTWDGKIQRYVVVGRSAVGMPTREIFGWFYDPTRSHWDKDAGEFRHPTIPVDPETGLPPFRELDAQAQFEIIDAMHRTFVAGRQGPGNWAKHVANAHQHNTDLHRKKVKQQAENMATILSEVDLRRPWIRMHSGPARTRRVARHA